MVRQGGRRRHWPGLSGAHASVDAVMPLPLPVAKREYDAARARMLRTAVAIARDLEHLVQHDAERQARAAVFDALVVEVGQKYEALLAAFAPRPASAAGARAAVSDDSETDPLESPVLLRPSPVTEPPAS